MTTFYPSGLKTYTLQSSISSTQSTITLTSFKVPVSDANVTMALMNTSVAYGTIAPRTTNSEFISFTGITQNSDGTATLTGVTRGLDKNYPYTTSATFQLPHAGATQFILSDAPQVFNKYGALENANTWSGIQTFSTQPVSTAGLPTNGTDLATKQYVDNTATGTTSTNRIIVAGTAGETITKDQVVYLKASDGRWWLADADLAATAENVVLGIAQGAGSAAGAIASGVLTQGLATFTAITLTANTKYYVSNTAGAFSSSAGTNEVTLGESQTTTTFLFYPRNDQQITEDQQDALVGDSGTPSATNTYVTQKGFQVNAEKYVLAASASSTAYTATLSPVPAAYATGMEVFVKIDVANTTATPTLNVNGLGAKTIVKGTSSALVANDLIIGQVARFVYDGTNMVLQNPSTSLSFTNGTTTKDASDASAAQTIAHGLGRIPKRVLIKALAFGSSDSGDPVPCIAETSYNGTTQSSISFFATAADLGSGGTATATFTLNVGGATATTVGVVTFDATNITITWTKTNSPTGVYQILWSAEG